MHVADVARELRAAQPDVQLLDVAYWSRASQGAISRFEHARSQPRDMDRLVDAYAYVLGVSPEEIMREALDRWIHAGGDDKDPPPGPPIKRKRNDGRQRTARTQGKPTGRKRGLA